METRVEQQHTAAWEQPERQRGWRDRERGMGVSVRDLRNARMPELLADFKVAYATTEPRLCVDVRMFSLYLIWMPTHAVDSAQLLFLAQSVPLVASGLAQLMWV